MSEYFHIRGILFTQIHIKPWDSIVSSNEAYFSHGFYQHVLEFIFYFSPFLLFYGYGCFAYSYVYVPHACGWKSYFFKEEKRERL